MLAQSYRTHGMDMTPSIRVELGAVDGSALLAQMQADTPDMLEEMAAEGVARCAQTFIAAGNP